MSGLLALVVGAAAGWLAWCFLSNGRPYPRESFARWRRRAPSLTKLARRR